MRFRASFEGKGFNDTCLSLSCLAAADERFDPAHTWARAGRPVLQASNRLRYLRWVLERAVERDAPMLAEYGASEIFHAHDEAPSALYPDHKFAWYVERVHAARERLDAEFDRDHTVSALARSVGMSMFSLHARVHRTRGPSAAPLPCRCAPGGWARDASAGTQRHGNVLCVPVQQSQPFQPRAASASPRRTRRVEKSKKAQAGTLRAG